MADRVEEERQGADARTFVDWYERFYESTQAMRDRALRDRGMYHGDHWTEAQRRELQARGQPANVYNEIKPVIDFLVGMEKQQRTDPRAYPRTPFHEQDAEAATDALRFVSEREDYDAARSMAWFDILTVGWGGYQLLPTEKRGGIELELSYNEWDRMWWDVHSTRPDFSDARYRGLIRWLDFEEAVDEYGEESRDALEAAKKFRFSSQNDLHDDKPRRFRWYDGKERRIAIAQVWYREKGEWYFAEFTGSDEGVLRQGRSPLLNEDGETTHPFEWESAFIDNENDRYGLVNELIDRQLEINKRGSKLMHLLTQRQTFGKAGAVTDLRRFKREAAKPDGHLTISDGANWGVDIGIIDQSADVAGHFQLLLDAKESIRRIGASSSLRGQDGPEQSGRAIQAKQQGNLIELGALMDTLRRLDKRVYRKMWNGIRQFWDGPKWVRVTDDERNVRFVGLNQPFLDPRTGEPRIIQVAQLDVDIVVEDAPDVVTLAGEQFENLVALASAGVTFPPEIYLRAAPHLRNKDELLDILQAQSQQPNPQAEIEMGNKQADTEKKLAEADRARMQAAKEFAEGVAGPAPRALPSGQ